MLFGRRERQRSCREGLGGVLLQAADRAAQFFEDRQALGDRQVEAVQQAQLAQDDGLGLGRVGQRNLVQPVAAFPRGKKGGRLVAPRGGQLEIHDDLLVIPPPWEAPDCALR